MVFLHHDESTHHCFVDKRKKLSSRVRRHVKKWQRISRLQPIIYITKVLFSVKSKITFIVRRFFVIQPSAERPILQTVYV